MSDAQDRRKSPRYRVDFAGSLLVDGASHDVRVKEVCRDAVLVEAGRNWPIGNELAVTLQIPGVEDAVAAEGRVVRVADEGQLAILFTELSDAAAARIGAFVALQEEQG